MMQVMGEYHNTVSPIHHTLYLFTLYYYLYFIYYLFYLYYFFTLYFFLQFTIHTTVAVEMFSLSLSLSLSLSKIWNSKSCFKFTIIQKCVEKMGYSDTHHRYIPASHMMLPRWININLKQAVGRSSCCQVMCFHLLLTL